MQLLGYLGGAALTGPGRLVRSVANRGHNQIRNRKLYLQGAITDLRREIANTSDAGKKAELRKQLYNLNKEYRDLSAQEVLTYGKYSLQHRKDIMNLNREIAFLEDQLKYGLDSGVRSSLRNKKKLLSQDLRLRWIKRWLSSLSTIQ